jgi:hypothetical protein
MNGLYHLRRDRDLWPRGPYLTQGREWLDANVTSFCLLRRSEVCVPSTLRRPIRQVHGHLSDGSLFDAQTH